MSQLRCAITGKKLGLLALQPRAAFTRSFKAQVAPWQESAPETVACRERGPCVQQRYGHLNDAGRQTGFARNDRVRAFRETARPPFPASPVHDPGGCALSDPGGGGRLRHPNQYGIQHNQLGKHAGGRAFRRGVGRFVRHQDRHRSSQDSAGCRGRKPWRRGSGDCSPTNHLDRTGEFRGDRLHIDADTNIRTTDGNIGSAYARPDRNGGSRDGDCHGDSDSTHRRSDGDPGCTNGVTNRAGGSAHGHSSHSVADRASKEWRFRARRRHLVP